MSDELLGFGIVFLVLIFALMAAMVAFRGEKKK